MLALSFAFAYGAVKIKSQEKIEAKSDFVKVAAIQHNSDLWQGNFENYRRDVQKLIHLTDCALQENPEIQLVVWPETVAVPSILKHFNGNDQKRKKTCWPAS